MTRSVAEKMFLKPGMRTWIEGAPKELLRAIAAPDLNLYEVIRIGNSHGLVESTCLSIDHTGSALRFTHPKPGKVYNNGHAELNLEETVS